MQPNQTSPLPTWDTNNKPYSNEPVLEVGIVSGIELNFHFRTPYRLINPSETTSPSGGQLFEGTYTASYQDGHIEFEGHRYDTLVFEPVQQQKASFELFDVRIGIHFHWERTEKQIFEGSLTCIVEGAIITAINRIPLESYLTSVISSEMSANASVELLKAHAVISRSWLLSQLQQKGKARKVQPTFVETETEHIRWYDREDHAHFDVCADDHCQRYQGITKASNPHVFDVIQATRGQVLCSGNEICDARFSKSCGGMMEGFQYCWENSPKPYLIGRPDRDCSQNKKDCKPNQHLTTLTGSSDKAASTADDTSTGFSDLRNEANAEAWILGHPESFCNTTDKKILSQVLNNYDQETTDFYRWQVFYSTETISKLIRERSGIDFGDIIDLIPVERGLSGRLVRLKIVGSKRTLIIGKELEIRRTLSPSHLYSSAFVVKKTPEGFTLHGAGWGHGVGLCQIGAAVMGEKGYTYQAILSHYYPNTIIRTLYQ